MMSINDLLAILITFDKSKKKSTFSALRNVFHDLLIAFKLRRNYLVSGDSQFVVDVVRMLRLLRFIDLQTRHYENLPGSKKNEV